VAVKATGTGKDEEIQLADLALPVGAPPPGQVPAQSAVTSAEPANTGVPLPTDVVSLKKFNRDQETAYIGHVLAMTGNDKEEAARRLDISLATLYRKLAEEGS
jgi:DNA-binding NtrC family response regulator